MIFREITYTPGLYKLFDEILVNAADNKQRDNSMTEIRVNFDVSTGRISVWNNGQSIPVVIHKEHNIYVPELIFGHLLTSSNYDDTEKRTVGGRNGYGAKLANIFSSEFTIDLQDNTTGLHYKQIFSNNMFKKSEPMISKAKGPSFTCVSFIPDYKRFNMTGLDDDNLALFTKRVFDIAGTAPKGLKVFLNGTHIKINNFKDYCDLYLPDPSVVRVHEKVSERWEVVIASTDGHFDQVSFVNSICTLKGGTHVNYLSDQVAKYVLEYIEKKHKKTQVKPAQIKNHLWIFVNSLIDNPAFDTQTKVNLTSKRQNFGSDPKLSEGFLKKVVKCGIVENTLAFAQFKQDKDLQKKDGKKKTGRLLGISKLEDANFAGSKRSSECTLILTEGDSAKALAMAGLAVVGRDLFGVFPLRGKLLNVREASSQQLANNQEITHLKQILGLQHGKVYTDTSSLRYGHVMIMTDQDYDGSHIKGLVINMFDTFWPSLLSTPGFLTEFITPIVKVSRGKREMPFYTVPEYETWKIGHEDGSGWKIKYYKGLGTSTDAEAKVYFANIDSHQIPFSHTGDQCRSSIELAFAKQLVDDRKDWIARYEPGTYLNHAVESIPFVDFINKELILFSLASNQRAIPSLVDGLKPGQRKIIFSCFKRKLYKEIKVAQLTGYVAENSAYHHGEASLAATIVNLAQRYVGSNNLNYLWPSGQFGTRAAGGSDSASPRYIFTFLSPATRALFHPDDDGILNYLNDDGQDIEPEWYVPVIPSVLVNGSSGIGTGWSTTLPNYNPRDVVANIRRMLNNEEPKIMHPYYKNFTGQIVCRGSSYIIRGLYEWIEDSLIHIYELPIGKWTSDYKTWIEQQQQEGHFLSFSEYHKDNSISFVITLSPEALKKAKDDELKYFKLETSLSTSNMVLFDSHGKIRRYDNAMDILKEFYDVRLEYYDKRKNCIIDKLRGELLRYDNRVRFILMVISDELKIRNVKKEIILQQLLAHKFDPVKNTDLNDNESLQEDDNADDEDDNSQAVKDRKKTDKLLKGYNYLLSMPLWSLTYERVEALRREREGKKIELDTLIGTSLQQLWNKDLDSFLQALELHEKKELEELEAGENAHYSKSGRGGNTRLNKMTDVDDDDNDDDDEWGAKKKKKNKTGSKTKEKIIPDYVLKIRSNGPKEQTVLYEEEPEKKVRKPKESKSVDPTDNELAMVDSMLSNASSKVSQQTLQDEEATSNLESLQSSQKTQLSQSSSQKETKKNAKSSDVKPKKPAKPKEKDSSTRHKTLTASQTKTKRILDSENDSSDSEVSLSESENSLSDDSSSDDEIIVKAPSKPSKPASVKPTTIKNDIKLKPSTSIKHVSEDPLTISATSSSLITPAKIPPKSKDIFDSYSDLFSDLNTGFLNTSSASIFSKSPNAVPTKQKSISSFVTKIGPSSVIDLTPSKTASSSLSQSNIITAKKTKEPSNKAPAVKKAENKKVESKKAETKKSAPLPKKVKRKSSDDESEFSDGSDSSSSALSLDSGNSEDEKPKKVKTKPVINSKPVKKQRVLLGDDSDDSDDSDVGITFTSSRAKNPVSTSFVESSDDYFDSD